MGARWQPLRRLHRLPAHRPTSPGQACGVRQEIRAVVRLPERLPEQGSSLAVGTQHHIDAWARSSVRGSGPSCSGPAATSTPELSRPLPHKLAPADIVAADTHWRLVQRLVHEPGLAVRDRMAGLLLLFAQPLSRICALTRDDVLDDDTTLRLSLETYPV